ncbi:MAG TPA: NmrA family NAD(P)-binding protein [Anaeromyxobacteraceae bacterium]|nr:NmrA family NAD(P)-binding protein [Anaeromyxobacteraceae bacterium]
MAKQVVAVVGGTGQQGGGVVDALMGAGTFAVRVASRNPAGDAARALAARGVEVVRADLLDPSSLRSALAGAHGAFVVTNFWDPAQMPRETEIGTAAVQAARAAGVQHLIWSTLPDSEKLTGGRLKVAHFSGKARVDAAVEAAGFARHTFAMAPMYFQNFLGMMAPQPLPNGGRGWAVPIDPGARVMHAGDVAEVGRAVAAAFAAGDQLPDGSTLGVCGGVYSFDDFVGTLNAQGHDLQVLQVPPAAYDGFYPGAHEMREMFQYFAEHTYFGPGHERYVAAANALVPGGFTSFADWARAHMKAV